MIISLSVLIRMRNVSDKSFSENQNTNFVLLTVMHAMILGNYHLITSTAGSDKMIVLWSITHCRLISLFRRFGKTCYIDTNVILSPSRWKQQSSSKCRNKLSIIRGVIRTQINVISIGFLVIVQLDPQILFNVFIYL